MIYFLVLVSTFFLDCICVEQSLRNKGFMRLEALDGKLSLGDVSAQFTPVISKPRCASLCMDHDGCVSFFYNNEMRTCRLVTSSLTENDAPDVEAFSRYYLLSSPCCRYTAPVTPTGNPRLAVAVSNVITMYDNSGTSILTINELVRAMFYHPFQQRLYLGTNPITSVKLDGSDQLTHGNAYTGTLMAFENNMFDNMIYLSISNYLVEKLAPDGTMTNLAGSSDVFKPRQNRIDTVENILYWADEELKTVKSVKVDGSGSVTTVFTTTQIVWGMDIDFDERKIYWCAKSTGKVSVYDMTTTTNTVIVPNGSTLTGSCSGLRLYYGYIYLIYYKLNYIEKRFKNGTLSAKILEGQLPISTTKYFSIVE